MLKETIKVKGHVVVKKRYKDGRVEIHEDKDNLVVSVGKTALAKLLGGDVAYAGLEHVSKMAFGTGGANPTVGDTALVNEAIEKSVTVSYPAFNSVMFAATMADTEGGSLTYQELGLKTDATGILFSRIAISPITKSTLYEIDVEWTISFQ